MERNMRSDHYARENDQSWGTAELYGWWTKRTGRQLLTTGVLWLVHLSIVLFALRNGWIFFYWPFILFSFLLLLMMLHLGFVTEFVLRHFGLVGISKQMVVLKRSLLGFFYLLLLSYFLSSILHQVLD
jgi:hypothetical protein